MKTAEMAVAQNFLSDASRKLPTARRTQNVKCIIVKLLNKITERGAMAGCDLLFALSELCTRDYTSTGIGH